MRSLQIFLGKANQKALSPAPLSVVDNGRTKLPHAFCLHLGLKPTKVWELRNAGADTEEKLVAAILRITAENNVGTLPCIARRFL